jgi:PmbA protein
MKELATQLCDRLKNKYGLDGEVFVSKTQGTNIEISEGHCEKFNLFNDNGIGVRVLKDGKWGLSYGTQLDKDPDELITSALENSRHNVSDEFNALAPAAASAAGDLAIYDQAIATISVNDKLKMMMDLERKALVPDPRITKVLTAAYTDSLFQQTIINTRGVAVSWEETFFSCMLELKAEQDTKIQVGGDSQTKRFFSELDLDNIIKQATFRTVSMLGARSVTTQKVPVVFDPYVGSEFLAMVASGVSAESIQRKKSPFINSQGKKISADFITIIDDGTMTRGIGSSPFDDEGVPTQRTAILRAGVLQGFLYDTYTASRDRTKSTGNASRGSFMGSPGVGVNNFYLEKGDRTPEELLQDVSQGLYVMEVMGMHTADPITGDFSVGVSGLWIENGRLSYPVQGVAMAGNILELMKNIEAVGSDLKFYGNVGCPTIKIKEMMISGE